MNKDQTKQGTLKINAEIYNLNPSTLITLFEIDIGDLLFDTGYIGNDQGINIFRFHNTVKLFPNHIIWDGKVYNPAPIFAEGFENITKGTLPTPKLAISVTEDGIGALTTLKQQIFKIGDLVGAKVTRIRTFAKFIDSVNFSNQLPPAGFSPDKHAYLNKDIFYVDRKSNETKSVIEYTLASILDVEGILLPNRVVFADRCYFTYRGEGCCYEYTVRQTDEVHGKDRSRARLFAPAAATFADERINQILGVPISDRGEYSQSLLATYKKGDQVFFSKHGINYYFVCRLNNPSFGPPDSTYWLADQCSKTVKGCKIRYGLNGTAGGGVFPRGVLQFGGYPGTNKYS